MPGIFNIPSPFGPEYRADVLKDTGTFISGLVTIGTSTVASGPCRIRGHIRATLDNGSSRVIFKEGVTSRFYLTAGVPIYPAEDPWNCGFTTVAASAGTNGKTVWMDVVLPAGWSVDAQDFSGSGDIRYDLTVEAL